MTSDVATAAAKRKESARLKRKAEEERRINLFAACRGGEVEVVSGGIDTEGICAYDECVSMFLSGPLGYTLQHG